VNKWEERIGGRDAVKKYSKQIVELLVKKETKDGHRIEKPDDLSDKKRAKIKLFIKEFMTKVAEHYEHRKGKVTVGNEPVVEESATSAAGENGSTDNKSKDERQVDNGHEEQDPLPASARSRRRRNKQTSKQIQSRDTQGGRSDLRRRATERDRPQRRSASRSPVRDRQQRTRSKSRSPIRDRQRGRSLSPSPLLRRDRELSRHAPKGTPRSQRRRFENSPPPSSERRGGSDKSQQANREDKRRRVDARHSLRDRIEAGRH
jgi:hypothetical protein